MPDPEPFVGEPLALDLVNTRPFSDGDPVDLIGSPEALHAWLMLQVGRLPGFPVEDAERLSASDLVPILEIRDHTAAIIECVRHGRLPPVAALYGLNAALRAAPAVRALTLEDGAIRSTVRRAGSPGLRLAACLADATADLVSGLTTRHIRQCAAEDCTMLFLATNQRRRWCSSARCGNRSRVAHYYRRHR